MSDFFIFLRREISTLPGVMKVYFLPYKSPAEVVVVVGQGLSEPAFDTRQAVYERFEREFEDYQVRERLDVEYRVVPAGDDISAPHIPNDALELPVEQELAQSS